MTDGIQAVVPRDSVISMSPEALVVPFDLQFADGVTAVCRELGWPSYADPAVAAQGCAAPGVSTFAAQPRLVQWIDLGTVCSVNGDVVPDG